MHNLIQYLLFNIKKGKIGTGKYMVKAFFIVFFFFFKYHEYKTEQEEKVKEHGQVELFIFLS